MTPERAVIVDACRSAAGRGGRGMLFHKRPDDLLAEMLNALIERNNLDPYDIKDIRLGVVNQMTYFVNGGAIALGHALGNSGSRIITTLAHEMKKRPDVKYGLATLCIGDGQGAATVLEKI